MTTYINDAIKKVHERLQDSLDGYQECFYDVNDLHLKSLIQNLMSKRQQMIKELKSIANKIGQALESSGSVTASAHRVFINLKSFVADGDKKSIINEIERGENDLIQTYKEASEIETTNTEFQELLKKHLFEISGDLATVRSHYVS